MCDPGKRFLRMKGIQEEFEDGAAIDESKYVKATMNI
jgi:hypothetical protein